MTIHEFYFWCGVFFIVMGIIVARSEVMEFMGIPISVLGLLIVLYEVFIKGIFR